MRRCTVGEMDSVWRATTRQCGQGGIYFCTRAAEHQGPHIAHTGECVVLKIWDRTQEYTAWWSDDEPFGLKGGFW